MEIGNFVKWSHTDEEGKFHHTGEVTKLTDEEVTIVISPSGSSITIDLTEDHGSFKVINKPADWGFVKPEKDITPMPAKVKAKKTNSGQASKKDLALELYKQMMDNSIHPSRKDVIDRFVAELGMTPAGASTYAAMCKKVNM